MSNLILNKSQAKACADAMCAMNNVSGKVDLRMDADIEVREMTGGRICVRRRYAGVYESYASQTAFFTAYGLE